MGKQQELKLVKKNSLIINRLRELNLDFNDLFILECFYLDEDRKFLSMYEIPSLKDFNISTRFQALRKDEYLVEDPIDTSKIIISVKGKDLVEWLTFAEEKHDPKNNHTYSKVIVNFDRTDDEKFEEWWKLYPTTTSWKSDDGNSSFIGSRNLKNLRKADAKKRYLKLLNQGLNHDELVGSLKYELKLKKVDSIKKGQNQMEYFKGMESYLNQERYLLFIDNFKDNPEFVKGEGEKIKGKKQNVTDI